MSNILISPSYRKDIDGLRAVAVIAVILYHFNLLPNGYLGVDIFFVISGYLITNIIYGEITTVRFSIKDFYFRRARRILPLCYFICLISLAAAYALMLPDDFENLAQSVVATNFFGNNVLQSITTKNYWDVANEFKPLMHTWSLGVEEQFYFIYPFIFVLFKNKLNYALAFILTLFFLSLIIFLFSSYPNHYKFYLIFFRFWELASGGILVFFNKKLNILKKLPTIIPVVILLFLLCSSITFPISLSLLLVITSTCLIICSEPVKNPTSYFLLQNTVSVFIGKISYSLYMWHQLVLAYARYSLFEELNTSVILLLLSLIIILSLFSYYCIERPFRNSQIISNQSLIMIMLLLFISTTIFALFVYSKAGVLQNIPELDIDKKHTVRGMHANYNHRIKSYDKDFNSSSTIKILVIGNSFARDWANVLLESEISSFIEISYIEDPFNNNQLANRSRIANLIFYSTPDLNKVRLLKIPKDKLWAVGTKSFGASNGIFYQKRNTPNYLNQRAKVRQHFIESNLKDSKIWQDRYIDILNKLADSNNTVPVFTPDGRFISQDCTHLTKAGAVYLAELFGDEIKNILGLRNKDSSSL